MYQSPLSGLELEAHRKSNAEAYQQALLREREGEFGNTNSATLVTLPQMPKLGHTGVLMEPSAAIFDNSNDLIQLNQLESEYYRLENEDKQAREKSPRPVSAPSPANFNIPRKSLTSDTGHSITDDRTKLRSSWASFPSSKNEITDPFREYNDGQLSDARNGVPNQRRDRKVSFSPSLEYINTDPKIQAPSGNFQSSPSAAARPGYNNGPSDNTIGLNQPRNRRPSFSSQNNGASGFSSSVDVPRPSTGDGPMARSNAVRRRPSLPHVKPETFNKNPPSNGPTFDDICKLMVKDGVGSCEGSNTTPNVAVSSQQLAPVQRNGQQIPEYSVQGAFGNMFAHMMGKQT